MWGGPLPVLQTPQGRAPAGWRRLRPGRGRSMASAQSWPCHFPAAGPWMSHHFFLSFSFLVSRMYTVTMPTSQDEIKPPERAPWHRTWQTTLRCGSTGGRDAAHLPHTCWGTGDTWDHRVFIAFLDPPHFSRLTPGPKPDSHPASQSPLLPSGCLTTKETTAKSP